MSEKAIHLKIVADKVQTDWGDVPAWAHESTKSLLTTLKVVEPSTYYHCLRVGEYARRMARDLGLNEYQQALSEFSGMLHDIGKVGISKDILLKPGRLNDDEQLIMKTHSEMSAAIVQPLSSHPFFSQIIPAIRGHHERMDGEGYPDKLLGESIPLLARIILVVDTFDAMSADRPYRKGLPLEAVYAELKRCSGTQFDKQIVTAFLQAQPLWFKDKEKPTEAQDKIVLRIA